MLDWLLHGQIAVGEGHLAVREVVGNVFGLASALLGMRLVVWAWPVGLVGNALLFTVFVSGELSGAVAEPLWGQAGRQVMFAIVGGYGWWRWSRHRAEGAARVAWAPRWATWSERLVLLAAGAAAYAVAWAVLHRIGSWGPATEAWILAGSLLATWGMARGWVEFWLVWIAVDVVGVTSLVRAGYYPTAAMYLFYGAFCVIGLFAWWRLERAARTRPGAIPVDEGVPA
ncbi:nicotinamide mononucleotide transporter family protein [Nocardioides pantholopis]|uniref:nicotinamide mononucleotide transporter family protein n=1 Tax=Nocardioides pantholopis TaxID=2483798 RepID=UPI000F07EBD2|nr:nicotinamide mononucleotide transporter family protein [Nocardioides pantholopis]